MKVLLFLAMLVPCQTDATTKGKSVKNADSLVSLHWGDKSRVVALTPSEKWSEGIAWILATRDYRRASWKGVYKVLGSSDDSEDLIYLRIALTRRYDYTTNDDSLWIWKLDPKFKPQGIMLEVPLEDGSIPQEVLTASVLRAFYADEEGKETVRRASPEGFLQKLAGEGDVISLRDPETVRIGETLRLRSGDNLLGTIRFPDLLPPGFRIRQKPVEVATNYRPEADPSFEKLWKQAKQSKDPKEILETSNVLLKLDSARVEIHEWRAWAFVELGEFQHAIDSYSKAIDIEPKNVSLHRSRASRYSKNKQYLKAKDDYAAVLQIDPNDELGLNGIAWIMATCPQADVRNGTKAIEHAKKLCHQTDFKNWMYVDTLAAAYAEAGDFRRAILWQTEVLDSLSDDKFREQVKSRLELYTQNKPYRED